MVTALGIDVRRAFTLVFAIGGAAAALAGVLAGVYFGSVDPAQGTSLLIFALHRRRHRRHGLGGRLRGRGGRGRRCCSSSSTTTPRRHRRPRVVALLAVVLLVRPGGLSAGRCRHEPPRLDPSRRGRWRRSALLALVPQLDAATSRSLFERPARTARAPCSCSRCAWSSAASRSPYDLLFGRTGLLSFGHALYFAAGVYGTAIVLDRTGTGRSGRLGAPRASVGARCSRSSLGAIACGSAASPSPWSRSPSPRPASILVPAPGRPHRRRGGPGARRPTLPAALVGVVNTATCTGSRWLPGRRRSWSCTGRSTSPPGRVLAGGPRERAAGRACSACTRTGSSWWPSCWPAPRGGGRRGLRCC